MKIKLDNREHQLAILLNQNAVNIPIEVTTLTIGDIIICDDEDNEILLIERKSVSDLASSITDGRYSEQSFRLDACQHHNHNIVYLIEGSIANYRGYSRINSKTLYSALFTLNYYKGFSVLRTTNISETCEMIIRIADKLNREKNKQGYYNGNIPKCEYTDVIKKEKKSNITKDNIQEIMLCQIPGISVQSARAILKKYDIKTLMTSVPEELDFSDIVLTSKDGKARKISKNAIEHIKKYLH